MKSIRISKQPHHWFSVFNLVIYMAVFTGRILRDAHLFTTPGGEKIFPLVFILNAVIITWVGSRLDSWEKKFGIKKMFALAFGGSAFFFLLSGFFFHPAPSTIASFLGFISVGNKWIAFTFYLVSEIPIFLSMNLIWMLAVDYFSEQQGQKDFPKISSIGLIGIVLASALALATQGLKAFPLYYLNFLLGGLSLILWAISWGILRFCSSQSIQEEDILTEEPMAEEKSPPFWKSAWKDYKWIKGYPFFGLFTIVTVCNFFLLAIFDQTLANVSLNKKITGLDLSVLLSKWTLGFGILAALFQWFGFPKLLKKKGVARTNLFAPRFMMLGTLGYLLLASDFLEPVWASLHWDASKYLLQFVIGARIAGWIAEFLFNQSMLPFVYGAPPSQDGNRGRFFIEGPVTAVTNGASGLFLIAYLAIFSQKDAGYGYKPDLLFVIALIAALFMWWLSKRMIPYFKEVLKKRVQDGEEIDKVLSSYRPELVDDSAVSLDIVQIGEWDTGQNVHQLRILRETRGMDAVPILKNYAIDDSTPAVNRALAIQEILELNAVDSFDEIWRVFKESEDVPHYKIIRSLGRAGRHFGRTSELIERFSTWLNKKDVNKKQICELLRNLSETGFDGAIIVSDFINKYGIDSDNRETFSPMQLFSQTDLYLITAELGSDRFYPKIAREARENGLSDWQAIGQIGFRDHKNILDAFALLLAQVEDINDEASSSLIRILSNHNWLIWPLLWLLELPHEKIPGALERNRHVWPSLIAKIVSLRERNNQRTHFSISSIRFFQQLKDKISPSCAAEIEKIDWGGINKESIREMFPVEGESNPGLNYEKFLINRLERPDCYALEVGIYVSFADALFEISTEADDEIQLEKSISYSLSQYRMNTLLASLFENWDEHASDWLKRRQKQWLNCYLLLLACKYPNSREAINRQTANNLLDDIDDLKRDNMLTRLEQCELPRNIFNDIRDDLDLPEKFAKTPGILKQYIEKDIRMPRTRDEAKELWEKLSDQIIPDQLLKNIIKKEKEVAYAS